MRDAKAENLYSGIEAVLIKDRMKWMHWIKVKKPACKKVCMESFPTSTTFRTIRRVDQVRIIPRSYRWKAPTSSQIPDGSRHNVLALPSSLYGRAIPPARNLKTFSGSSESTAPSWWCRPSSLRICWYARWIFYFPASTPSSLHISRSTCTSDT